MTSLRFLQKSFTLALLDSARGIPSGIRTAARGTVPRRFGVYRNNVVVSLTEALAARFPVCLALVGDEFFRSMTRLYIEASPPRSPLLMTYGDDLAEFIEAFPPAQTVPYLGDIARLEAARTRAYHAADAAPIDVDELAALGSRAWAEARVVLHPSIELISSAYPIVTIWKAHQRQKRRGLIDGAQSEDALVARPKFAVEIYRLPPGGAVFMSELVKGATFREAADEAAASDYRFEIVNNLTGLMANGLIIGLLNSERE
jgi:hypothetical protein